MSEVYAAVIGLLIGAAIAAAGFLFKRRADNLSKIHEALFQLLELYAAIRMSFPVDIEQNLEWYFEVAHEVFPDAEIEKHKLELKEVFLPTILEASKKITKPDEGYLIDEYRSAISRISSIAPVLAFRLSSNRSIKNLFSQIDQYNNNVMELINDEISKEDNEQINFMTRAMKKRVYNDAAKTLKKDIVILSMRCGFLSFAYLIKRLYFTKAQTMESIMKEEYRWLLLEAKNKSVTET